MTIKVLPNDLQSSIALRYKMEKIHKKSIADNFDPLDRIVGTVTQTPRFPAIYNRVGYYLRGNLCWYEFQLLDNSFVAVESSKSLFNYKLSTINGGEICLLKKEAEALEILVSRGIIKPPKWYADYEQHLIHKNTGRRMKRQLLQMKARIKAKIDATRS